jgi:hypothetical protein
LKLETLVMIQTKFGFHWSSTFRGEDFWKSLRRTTDDDDERQVMGIAHLTQRVRWAKKKRQRTNNDPQNTTQKTKDRATRTPLKNVDRQLIHRRRTKPHQWCNG